MRYFLQIGAPGALPISHYFSRILGNPFSILGNHFGICTTANGHYGTGTSPREEQIPRMRSQRITGSQSIIETQVIHHWIPLLYGRSGDRIFIHRLHSSCMQLCYYQSSFYCHCCTYYHRDQPPPVRVSTVLDVHQRAS